MRKHDTEVRWTIAAPLSHEQRDALSGLAGYLQAQARAEAKDGAQTLARGTAKHCRELIGAFGRRLTPSERQRQRELRADFYRRHPEYQPS